MCRDFKIAQFLNYLTSCDVIVPPPRPQTGKISYPDRGMDIKDHRKQTFPFVLPPLVPSFVLCNYH